MPVPLRGMDARSNRKREKGMAVSQILYSYGDAALCVDRKLHQEDIMARRSMTVNTNVGIGALLACLLSWLGMPVQASAQVMENYTNMPITINKTVEPNVLFLVDLGSATLEAAYTTTTRTGYYYPQSYDTAANTYVSGTGKAYYAANFTADNVTLTVPLT